jgi:hypothetical protein
MRIFIMDYPPPQHAYTYSKLAKPTNFRIFQLVLKADTIIGTLEEHDLDDPPEYECVSYVWGLGPKNHRITIDEGFIWVTETLASALLSFVRNAHHSDCRTRALWIDQITINQDDLNEKSQQVQQMGQIYKKAQRDVLWMGLPTPKSVTALNWLSKLGAGWYTALRGDLDWYSPASHVFWNLASKLHSPSAEVLDALEEIFDRCPPWHRVWIVQEIVLSRDVLFLSGDFEIPMTLFAHILSKAISAEVVPLLSFTSFVNIILLKWNIESQKWLRLEQILSHNKGWEATDPRDLVYAFLGLVPNPGIIPDYTKSVSQVFLDMSTTIVLSSEILDFICFNQCITNRNLTLPTWVQHFGLPNAASTVGSWPTTLAAGTDAHNAFSVSISGTTLTAAGRHIDSIASIINDDEHKTADISKTAEAGEHFVRILATIAPHLLKMAVDASQPALTEQYDPIWQTFMVGTHLKKDGLSPENNAILRSDFFRCCYVYSMIGTGNEPSRYDSYFMDQWWVDVGAQRQQFAITEKHGYFVAVNQDAQVGDEICVLSTAKVPLVVRRKTSDNDNSDEYIRLGTAYVDGVMFGEAWSQEEKYPKRTYKLV